MAQDFSFDVVSEVDRNEVRNAVNLAQKEIATRYDFKKSVSKVDLDGDDLVLVSDNEGKLHSVIDLLEEKLARRKVPLKALQYGKVEAALGGTVRQRVTVTHGIPDEKAKAVSKLVRAALQEGQGADPGRRRARLLGQEGRAPGGHAGAARRGLRHPSAVHELPLTGTRPASVT